MNRSDCARRLYLSAQAITFHLTFRASLPPGRRAKVIIARSKPLLLRMQRAAKRATRQSHPRSVWPVLVDTENTPSSPAVKNKPEKNLPLKELLHRQEVFLSLQQQAYMPTCPNLQSRQVLLFLELTRALVSDHLSQVNTRLLNQLHHPEIELDSRKNLPLQKSLLFLWHFEESMKSSRTRLNSSSFT